MAQLLVRQIEDSLVKLLKKQASGKGRSAEEEHRLILREALTGISKTAGPMSLKEYLVADPLEDLELPLTERHHSSERELDL